MSTFTDECCDDKDEMIPAALSANSESARDIMDVLGTVVDSLQLGMTSSESYLKEVKSRLRRSISTQTNYSKRAIESVSDYLSEALSHALADSGTALAIVQQDAMLLAPDAYAERQSEPEQDENEEFPTTVFTLPVPTNPITAPLPSTFRGPPDPSVPTFGRTGLSGGGELGVVSAPSQTSLLDFQPGQLTGEQERAVEVINRLIREQRVQVVQQTPATPVPQANQAPSVPLFPDVCPLPEAHATPSTPATNELINQSQVIVRTFRELLYAAAPELMRGIEGIAPTPPAGRRAVPPSILDLRLDAPKDDAPPESDIEVSESDV